MHDFVFLKAESISDALKLKDEYKEEASFIAGGTDLLVDLRNEKVEPEALIDISDLSELVFVKENDGEIEIGACTSIYKIQESAAIQRKSPILYEACKELANPLIKNRGTLGGNLINASPAADTAPPLMVLGAEAVLGSVEGERTMPLEELFLGVKKTCLKDNEMLKKIRFEESGERKGAFLKVGQRVGSTISIASLSILTGLDGDKIVNPKIAMGSVAPTPIRTRKTEEVLSDEEIIPSTVEKASDTIKQEVSPISDVRGSANYRAEVSEALLKKALESLS